MTEPIRLAVVTGGHPFDVPNFVRLFRALPGIDAYLQHMEDFAMDFPSRTDFYDVVLFYTFYQETPAGGGPWYQTGIKSTIESLGERPKPGLFLLHHSILAYPDWPLWHDMVGLDEYGFTGGYHIGERVKIHVEQPQHPIVRGLSAWEMTDETYEMNEPRPDCDVLLSIEHPKSLRACAWTREFRNARVFCMQSGHDNETWREPNFQTVVTRGVEWCAGRI